MSCCAKPTREQFLTEKLANFKKYLEPFCTTEEMKTALLSYSSLDAAMPGCTIAGKPFFPSQMLFLGYL
jgi:hypothetical protein